MPRATFRRSGFNPVPEVEKLWFRIDCMRILNLLAPLLIASSFLSAPLQAETFKDVFPSYTEWLDETLSPRFGTLELHRGPQALPNGIVSLNLPPDYYALLGADAQWVMQYLWGNLPDPDLAALTFQTGTTPLDGSWGASVYWVDQGHISDIEADMMDFDAILNSYKDNDVEFNRQRTAQGMATLTTLGLSGVQGDDKLSHALRFSLLLRQEAYDQDVLSANVWVLAGHGYEI
jgi:uncharacterized membrane-anchored protein